MLVEAFITVWRQWDWFIPTGVRYWDGVRHKTHPVEVPPAPVQEQERSGTHNSLWTVCVVTGGAPWRDCKPKGSMNPKVLPSESSWPCALSRYGGKDSGGQQNVSLISGGGVRGGCVAMFDPARCCENGACEAVGEAEGLSQNN